jgi:DNA polymerase-1
MEVNAQNLKESELTETGCTPSTQIEGPTTPVASRFIGVLSSGKEVWLEGPRKNGKYALYWRVPSTREAIRARPGWKILDADYSQVEIRIAAELSGDPWLTAAINSGKDIHCYMASDVYGIPYDEFYTAWKDHQHPKHDEYSKSRSNVKGITFGLLYGAGPKGLAWRAKISEADARDLINRFYRKARGLKSWFDGEAAKALTFGFVSTKRGRTRFYSPPTTDFEEIAETEAEKTAAREAREEEEAHIRRQARNNPIQMTCVDILKLALTKINFALHGGDLTKPRIYDAHFILCVHDEILMTAREEHAEAVAKIMRDCMLEAYGEVMKTVAHGPLEVKMIDNWAEK